MKTLRSKIEAVSVPTGTLRKVIQNLESIENSHERDIIRFTEEKRAIIKLLDDLVKRNKELSSNKDVVNTLHIVKEKFNDIVDNMLFALTI